MECCFAFFGECLLTISFSMLHQQASVWICCCAFSLVLMAQQQNRQYSIWIPYFQPRTLLLSKHKLATNKAIIFLLMVESTNLLPKLFRVCKIIRLPHPAEAGGIIWTLLNYLTSKLSAIRKKHNKVPNKGS